VDPWLNRFSSAPAKHEASYRQAVRAVATFVLSDLGLWNIRESKAHDR
jgi:hypothetical protein